MLTWLAIGLPFFVTFLFMMRGFYARRDTRTPFIISLWQNAVQIVLSLALAAVMGFQGALLGFTLAYVFGAVMAMGRLARQAGGMGPPVGRALGRYLVAAAVHGPDDLGNGPGHRLGRPVAHRAPADRAPALAGGAVYVVVLWLLGSDDLVLIAQLRGDAVDAGPGHRPRAETMRRPRD